MTPSKQCKQAGLPSLAYASKESKVDRRTLERWFTSKPELFRLVIKALAFEYEERK